MAILSQLPSCANTLGQHTLRAASQTAIQRHSLCNDHDVPHQSEGHRWKINADGELDIVWMTIQPASDVKLNEMSCSCSRICQKPDCLCLRDWLKCTVQCKLKNCWSIVEEEKGEQTQVTVMVMKQKLMMNCVAITNKYVVTKFFCLF